jgi:diguanylate cyclase (GGDEF)-like protein
MVALPEVIKCSLNNEASSKDVLLLHHNPTVRFNLSELSQILQLNLDPHKILQSFFTYIKNYFKITNLLYINSEHSIQLQLGPVISAIKIHNKNLLSCELIYQEKTLGKISFSTKNKLNNHEVILLKNLVKVLILPIKNGLLYHNALIATRKDQLTKISNRLALYEDLQYHFSLAKRHHNNFSVLFVDIDYFKKINDKYGHLVGDQVLIHFADLLKSIIRKSDSIYRFGGEEFVVILDNTNQNGSISLAKKLIDYTRRYTIQLDQKSDLKLNITISVGVATKKNTDTETSLLNRADQALYAAKNKGRNCYVVKK